MKICSGGDGSPISNKRTALQQLVEASIANDHSVWTKVGLTILIISLLSGVLSLVMMKYKLFHNGRSIPSILVNFD